MTGLVGREDAMRRLDADSAPVRDIVAVVLAGGRGARLGSLTRDRAKPAVPFGGIYRIVDFVLSNCLNSGLRRVLLLTQYKARSLNRHVDLAWHRFFCRELGEFLDVLPPQQRVDDQWYQGTADAVFQNIYSLELAAPRHVLVLAGDHVCTLDYRQLVEAHEATAADVTVGAIPVPRAAGSEFGTMEVDASGRIRHFREKVADPPPLPGSPGLTLASMGIYCFSTGFLLEQLRRDAVDEASRHDFGHDILPRVIRTHGVQAFRFRDEIRMRDAYWRDVGTIDAYHDATMDLLDVDPRLDLHDTRWPIRTHQPAYPPPKLVSAGDGDGSPRGDVTDSLVCGGAIVSGGSVHRSVIGPGVRVDGGARIEESVLFEGVDVGRGAVVCRTIVDKGVRLPAGTAIGVDPAADQALGLTVSPTGITVVPKGFRFPAVPAASRTRPVEVVL